MPVSLIGPLDNNQVQRVLLVAAYAGVTLKVVPITEGLENRTEAYRLNISPLMRVPALKTDEGYLCEPHAMVRYLARIEVMMLGASTAADDRGEPGTTGGATLSPDGEKIPHPQYPVPYALYGHSLVESAEVDAWLDFTAGRIDSLVQLFANAEVKKAGGASGFYAGELRRPTEKDRKRLFANLVALENRLAFLREARRALVQEAGGSITARSYLDEELMLHGGECYDEGTFTAGGGGGGNTSAIGKKDSRVSNVYNVAGAIRNKMNEQDRVAKERQMAEIKSRTEAILEGAGGGGEEGGPSATGLSLDLSRINNQHSSSSNNSRSARGTLTAATPRDSMISPRVSSVLKSARGGPIGDASGMGTGTGGAGHGSVIQRNDLLFLVGDSLTAADLALAMAIHAVYQVPSLKTEAINSCGSVYKYYKAIMMLPVASDMRKALRINMA